MPEITDRTGPVILGLIAVGAGLVIAAIGAIQEAAFRRAMAWCDEPQGKADVDRVTVSVQNQ